MTKPQWLVDNEKKKNAPEPSRCCGCANFKGRFIRYAKYKNKEKCEVWECRIHPGCCNTRFSIVCSDFDEGMMV